MKPGGTEGGDVLAMAGLGCLLLALGGYLFFDSVRVSSADAGWISGAFRGGGAGGFRDTASMGLVFVPFLLGVGVLFFDAR
ncbi:MAG: hypothetical protein ACQKBY_09495 [Verrucomicrobiales bacterium]